MPAVFRAISLAGPRIGGVRADPGGHHRTGPGVAGHLVAGSADHQWDAFTLRLVPIDLREDDSTACPNRSPLLRCARQAAEALPQLERRVTVQSQEFVRLTTPESSFSPGHTDGDRNRPPHSTPADCGQRVAELVASLDGAAGVALVEVHLPVLVGTVREDRGAGEHVRHARVSRAAHVLPGRADEDAEAPAAVGPVQLHGPASVVAGLRRLTEVGLGERTAGILPRRSGRRRHRTARENGLASAWPLTVAYASSDDGIPEAVAVQIPEGLDLGAALDLGGDGGLWNKRERQTAAPRTASARWAYRVERVIGDSLRSAAILPQLGVVRHENGAVGNTPVVKIGRVELGLVSQPEIPLCRFGRLLSR